VNINKRKNHFKIIVVSFIVIDFLKKTVKKESIRKINYNKIYGISVLKIIAQHSSFCIG
jgi:phage-related holin